MAQVQFYRVTADQLSDLAITDGRLIFTTDTQKLYLDNGTNRVQIDGIDFTYGLTRDGQNVSIVKNGGSSAITLPIVTTSAAGLMSAADKTKLNGIATGATKVIVDSSISSTSTNAIQNKVVYSELSNKLNTSLKGAKSGLAELNADGLVPSSQLPSYVDDVLEYDSKDDFPTTGEVGKIYVATDTNLTYRWGGSAYVEISASLALGETSATAYRGDRGKIAYDHSQVTSGNPHKVTKSDVGLGNADNTADANKSVKSATQLTTARTIDGINFNGTAAISHYGTCSTAAATAAKVVACSNYTLVTGSRIIVRFGVTNTAAVANLTLNVNSTGAKSIKYRNGNLSSANILAVGRTYEFVYDGTNYQLIGDLDTNTNTNTTYTLTQDSSDGHKITLTPSTGTATTITIPDNNTTYENKSASSGGTDVSLVTTGEKYTWNNKTSLAIGSTATTAAAGNHTHSISLATSTGTSSITLSHGTKYGLTAGGNTVIFTTPSDSDTKNTAGSTDSSSKLFLIGATSQAVNPQTYSQDTVYVGTDGQLYSNSKQVVNLSDKQALTNKTYNGYTLAAASAKGVDTSIAAASTSANLPTSAAVAAFVEGKGYLTSQTLSSGTITEIQANGTSVATSGVANIPAASTSAYGVTKLSSATNSTSTTLAATASAVKAAYDLAKGKLSSSNVVNNLTSTSTSAPLSAYQGYLLDQRLKAIESTLYGSSYSSTWSSSSTYSSGAIVSYNGKLYKNTTGKNTTTNPSSNTTNWSVTSVLIG